jgi:hypothetical protein
MVVETKSPITLKWALINVPGAIESPSHPPRYVEEIPRCLYIESGHWIGGRVWDEVLVVVYDLNAALTVVQTEMGEQVLY